MASKLHLYYLREYYDYFDVIKIDNITYGEVSAKRCGRITMEDRVNYYDNNSLVLSYCRL